MMRGEVDLPMGLLGSLAMLRGMSTTNQGVDHYTGRDFEGRSICLGDPVVEASLGSECSALFCMCNETGE